MSHSTPTISAPTSTTSKEQNGIGEQVVVRDAVEKHNKKQAARIRLLRQQLVSAKQHQESLKRAVRQLRHLNGTQTTASSSPSSPSSSSSSPSPSRTTTTASAPNQTTSTTVHEHQNHATSRHRGHGHEENRFVLQNIVTALQNRKNAGEPGFYDGLPRSKAIRKLLQQNNQPHSSHNRRPATFPSVNVDSSRTVVTVLCMWSDKVRPLHMHHRFVFSSSSSLSEGIPTHIELTSCSVALHYLTFSPVTERTRNAKKTTVKNRKCQNYDLW